MMLYNIQALRALAACMVIVIHLDAMLLPFGVPTTSLVFGNGGVDLFFVISGFVMVHTTTLKPVTPGAFFLNRLVRIAPMYWLMTFAIFAVALVAPSLLGATRASPVELVKSLLFIPFMKASGLIQPMLLVGWTLNYEMFFYAIFALSLLLKAPEWRALAASVAIVGLVALSALLHPTATIPRFYGAPIMIEFVMGMWVAIAYGRGMRLSSPVAAGALALGLAALIGHRFFLVGQRAWLAGLPSLVIVAAALSLEARGHVLRDRRLQLVGAASFSIYLIHQFITQGFTKLVGHVRLLQTVPAIVVIVPLIFVIVALVGIAVHLRVELPLTRWLRRRVGHAPSIVEREEIAAADFDRPAVTLSGRAA